MLRTFAPAWPGVHLSLSEVLPEPLYDGVRSGRFDLGVLREPVPDLVIVSHMLCDEPFAAVLPADHPLAGSDAPLQVEALCNDPFILFHRAENSYSHDRLMEVFRDAGFRPRVAHQVWTWQSAIGLVGAGLGVSLLPWCVTNLRQENVSYRALACEVRTKVGVLTRKEDPRPAIAAFVEQALGVDW